MGTHLMGMGTAVMGTEIGWGQEAREWLGWGSFTVPMQLSGSAVALFNTITLDFVLA